MVEPRDVRQVREGLLRADAPPPAQDLGPGCRPPPGAGSAACRTSCAPAARRHRSRAAGRRLGLRVRRGARRGGRCAGSRASGRWTTAAIATLSASVQSASPSRQAQCAMFGTRGGAAGRTNVGRVRAAAPRHRQRRDARVVRARGLLQPLRLPALEPAAARRHELRRDRVDDAADLRVRHVRLPGGRREGRSRAAPPSTASSSLIRNRGGTRHGP